MVEEWEAAETRKIKKTGGMKPGVLDQWSSTPFPGVHPIRVIF